MPQLITIASNSSRRCCATCRVWTERNGAACARVDVMLPADLTTVQCAAWEREETEASARVLYATLPDSRT